MKNLMKFENQQVEIINYNGIALFNPYQVGKCLDLSESGLRNHLAEMNQKQAITLKNSDVLNMDFRKLNNRGEKFITKSGVYKLIFKSHKPDAEKFQDWVTDEVLPQIEQTGGYVQENRELEFIEKYFPSFADNTKLAMVEDLYTQNKKYQDQIQKLLPQAEAYQDLMTAQGYINFIDLAQSVEIGRTKLLDFLRQKKVLTKQSAFNTPYGRFAKNGCFKVVHSKNDKGRYITVTLVSPKGTDYIHKLVKKYHMENEFDTNKLLDSFSTERTVA